MRPQGRESKREQERTRPRIRWLANVARAPDSYALVLALIFLDYIAVSTLYDTQWGRLIVVLLLGVTLLITLYTSRAGRGVVVLAWIFVAGNTVQAMVTALAPVDKKVTVLGPFIGAVLLIVAPVVILRRITAHNVVSVDTILGAIDVYLLFGMIFALLYSGFDALGSGPFFAGVAKATSNDYLFFSYSTLTTVGYGNLVPAGNLGQTFAMVEALLGQIYLVIVVARLVSLWGQARPKVDTRLPDHTGPQP